MTQFAVAAECPKCRRSESWSVWYGLSGYLMGTCHRASCGWQGQLEGAIAIQTPKKKEPRHYTRPIVPLNDRQVQMIEDRFGLIDVVDGYNETDDRFILGVYGPVGYNRRGVVAYSLSGGTPKSLTYNEKPDEPWVHYTDNAACKASRVVVEDWFSAQKVSEAAGVGVAIMGTNLSQAMVTELVSVAYGPTFIALDRDAYAKTIGYVAKYREQFPLGLYAWSLKQDLKYETTERIKRALDGDYDFTSDVKQPERV